MEIEEALRRISEWSKKNEEKFFDFSDVKIPPHVLNKLWDLGFINLYTASKRRNYYTPNLEKIEDFLRRIEKRKREREKMPDFDKLFKDIIGLESHKKLISRALSKGERIHVLLVGPPESAKTLILSKIENLPNSFYVLGATLSDAGLIEQLAIRKPKFLLIDEIDKIKKTEIGALLELMETGRLLKTKKGMYIDEELNCTVIATANRIDRLPHELVSRFLVVRFEPYSKDEFFKICENLIKSKFSKRIIEAVWEKTKSIRDVIKLSKIVESEEEIEEFVSILGGKNGEDSKG